VKATKIILLSSPDADLHTLGGFIRHDRDKSFYIQDKAEGETLSQFRFSAISGEEVLRGREGRNWGLEVPWRVTVLCTFTSTSISNSVSRSKDEHKGLIKGDSERKKKPGKKRRILLRTRERERREKEEMKRKEREGKEEAEREKRTRRNREKKVKRKMKEKALKASSVVEEALVT
jgi:Fungal protein of unknown function (DUF2011)